MNLLTDEKRFSKKDYISFILQDIAALLLLWALITYSGLVKSFFLPPPDSVFSSFEKLLFGNSLMKDIWVSFYRVSLGFTLATIFAVPVGIFIGTYKKAKLFIEPIISFIRFMPPSGFVPLFILWFGIGDEQKILLIFISIAPFLALFVFDIAQNTERELVEAAYTLGAKTRDIILKVVVPRSLPGIWDAMRVLVGAAWSMVVLAEIVAADSGLGHLIINSQRFLQTANVILAILIIGVIGFLTDYFFKLTYGLFFPWSEKLS
jgi:NitT/TauT family transport system permease protein